VNKDSSKIETGSKVGIIGGGPAGSFFALYLLHYAIERGIHPEITIYQQRNFDELGPKGCKGCAGILPIALLSNLGELDLSVPEGVIQSTIEHYAVHSPYTSITISNPEKGIGIASIYRGGGPRVSDYEIPISFDGWLLRQAQRRGIKIEYQAVSRIYLDNEAGIEVAGEKLAYDLVVLASGVNTKPIPVIGLEYVHPKTQIMAQDELHVGSAEVEYRLSNTAHVFLIPHSGLIFGTLVPKGPFINVSVLSSSKYPVSIADFLNYDIVRHILPSCYDRACGCRPRMVVSSAQNYYADRFVAVGDAAVTRLYKDGIGSSLLTAREAARVVAYHGLSGQDSKHHYQQFCRSMNQENWWGRLLFRINDRAKDSRAFLLAQHRLVADEQDNMTGPQPFTKFIWGMFTGSYSYKSLARMAFGPTALAKLCRALLTESPRILLARKRAAYPKKLHVGRKRILILGGGFGGTYTLRHLVRRLNRNENVETTMVSDENFFLFTPLLHEVAMGGIETRHIAYPIRRLHWRDRFNFVQARVEKIDLSAHRVTTTTGDLEYDYLVMALGSHTAVSDLNSIQDRIFTLKTLSDAVLLGNHIIKVFEQASIERNSERQRQLLTFVVSGAGYTGVQVVCELRDYIFRNLTRFYKSVDPGSIKILLIEAERKIAPELHTKLGAYAMKHLQQKGIEVRLRSRVTHVWEDQVEINGTEIIPASTLIWVAGVVANARIAELDVERDTTGRVLVNQYLEVPGVPGVYAAGDCAHFEDSRTGQPIPPRAHTAVRQARIVAHNILAEIRGRDKKPYRYSDPAEVVSLGFSNAVCRLYGLLLCGFPARLIWLLGNSFLVTGTYNRVRIITDWLLSLVFGRDTTLLRLTKL
jgi:NADH dehydrogenase